MGALPWPIDDSFAAANADYAILTTLLRSNVAAGLNVVHFGGDWRGHAAARDRQDGPHPTECDPQRESSVE